MYAFDHTDGAITLSLAGTPVLSGLRPHLTLDNGTTVRPALLRSDATPGEDGAGTYTDHVFAYQDDAETLMLTLSFRVYAEAMVASATVVSLGKAQIGVRARGLAPFEGLELRIADLDQVEGLMANYLHKDWWTRPHFDPDPTALPPRTQSVLWRTASGYHHLIGVADAIFKTEFVGKDGGMWIVTAAYDGGYINFSTVLFALASGDDVFALPDRNVTAALHALGTPYRARDDRRYPEIFEYLGWCSWDAFYHEVSADGVLAKAHELQEKALPVRWFIIDDGWLSHIDRALTAFEPDPEKFPDGFAALAQRLKDEYGLSWLGVWHTLFGYWNGIHPESALAQTMGDAVHTTHTGKVVPSPEVAEGFTFWDVWHTALRNAGVDFVKVDYQSGLVTFWQQELAIGTAARHSHAALEASVGKNFDNALINCMGMATENLWHRPISAVTRNSDDFFPAREGSFTEHALQNAYNAYYHAPLMWLDWDMWWTQHPSAATHAVLRAVSGGPIYVSDRVGETDAAQLWPLMLSDGRLLRCDRPGVATEDCLFVDPSQVPVPLKVWSRVGDAGVVAAVNVHLEGTTVRGSLSPADVPDLPGERFVIYEHFSGSVQTLHRDTRISIALEPDAAALYAIVPVAGPVTPIGLGDKYIAPAAIADWFTGDGITTVILLDGGRVVWAAENAPAKVRVNGEVVDAEAGPGVFSVDCSDLVGTVWVTIAHGS